MISFNLTALTRETPLIQRKVKTRESFPRKTSQNFTLNSFIVSTFILLSHFSLRIPSKNTALQYFKKKAMAETNSQFNFEEDQEMESQPIYLSSNENEIDSLHPSPIPQLPNNIPDPYSAITQSISARHEQISLSGTYAPQYPITPPTSLISDDEDDDMLTPITGNPAQFLPYTPNRHPIPIQLCQQITPIPDTPESPTPENRGQSNTFRPDDILNQPTSIPLNNPPNIMAVADELRNMTLCPHPQRNEWVTSCLVCGKSYDQVIEDTVADYLHQTAQPGETVRESQIKRNAFIDGIQSGVFSERQQNVVVNEATNDRDFTVGTSNNDSVVNGNAMSMRTLERCFNERIDREMNNIVDTVEDRIQNAILAAIENIVTPKIELAIRSINASSGRDTTSVCADSERKERVGINASFENASKNNDTLDVSNVNDENRHNIPDEVSELSVPETRFDRQPQTHHSSTLINNFHVITL